MQITSLDTRGDTKKGRHEPVEEIEIVSLKQENPKKTVKIGSKLEEGLKKKLVNCLQTYANVFVWSHDDMLKIDPTNAFHKLAIRKV